MGKRRTPSQNTKYKTIYMRTAGEQKEEGETNMDQDSLNELEAAMLEND